MKDQKPKTELSRAILTLCACSDIALDSINVIKESGSKLYRHKTKQALNNSQTELEGVIKDYFDWENEEEERIYHSFTSIIELMSQLISETPSDKLNELHEVLTAVKNGDYKTES